MKTIFDTEKEAQRALKPARNLGLGFCPLIKHECRVDCICYYEGDIHQSDPITQGKYWFIHYPCCTNVLISGVITVEN